MIEADKPACGTCRDRRGTYDNLCNQGETLGSPPLSMDCHRGFGVVAKLIAAFSVASKAEWQIRLSILGVPFSLLYFVQKQKMEELELFKRLFTEFNHRYDRLNEKLNAIRDKPPEKEIEDD